jgi:hypothetical protein
LFASVEEEVAQLIFLVEQVVVLELVSLYSSLWLCLCLWRWWLLTYVWEVRIFRRLRRLLLFCLGLFARLLSRFCRLFH